MRVFNLGFPRCGTNTLTIALTRAGLSAYHASATHRSFGSQIMGAWNDKRDPFDDIPAHVEAILHPSNGDRWPQLHYDLVQHLRDTRPSLVFLLPTRPIWEHVESFTHWAGTGFTFRQKIIPKDLPGLPAGAGRTDGELGAWIARHYFALEKRFKGDKRLVTFDIRDEKAPAIIGKALGLELPWWGKRNAR